MINNQFQLNITKIYKIFNKTKLEWMLKSSRQFNKIIESLDTMIVHYFNQFGNDILIYIYFYWVILFDISILETDEYTNIW